MSKIVKNVQDKLTAAISAAFEKAISAGTLPEAEIPAFNIEVPADRANGDFSTLDKQQFGCAVKVAGGVCHPPFKMKISRPFGARFVKAHNVLPKQYTTNL